MVWRGMFDAALPILKDPILTSSQDDHISRLALLAVALAHLQRFSDADATLRRAEQLCQDRNYASCGDILRARGILSLEHGDFPMARDFFLRSLAFARAHHDKPLETTALLNLGSAYLHEERYDEAVDWTTSAYRAGLALGDENRVQGAIGNLGWAYFGLGDLDRALELFLDAEARAARLGNIPQQINWVNTTADVYFSRGELSRSISSYLRALELARKIGSKEYTINALEELSHVLADTGNLSAAEGYLNQLEPLVLLGGNRLDALEIELAKGRIALIQHQDPEAERRFRIVEDNPASQISMRLGAEHGLAQLYESENNIPAADKMYRAALATFDSARDRLKNEDSKLPFLANATTIYDDYIHLLVAQGQPELALRIADQSRAQTLAQGLGVTTTKAADLRPEEVARKTGSTLLFYWLGEKQSYLWAITPRRTLIYTLPPQRDIANTVERYRKTLLGIGDPIDNSDPDGTALYRMLVAPASEVLRPDAKFIVLTDGVLSLLNFETLIVPTLHPHYLIEDAAITSAPSLHLLAAANSSAAGVHKLLLLGDAISSNPDYPDLPMAFTEMKQIEQHFDAQNQTVLAREQASPAAYLAVNPQKFGYIHFVAHGVASRTDPLDSAIILSPSSAAEDSFKLHAREIIQHPIHADLVTVSACYGSGTRSYAGEGSIGLAWAFLRAGAHNVIGALWEVSDESTPELMDRLYAGLQKGESPSIALHQAKLTMLHSQKEFRKPFYWAPLQIYTGL
ncbi:MAG TPA: CHAT domain-containing protein [Terracidiphilus sp.]